MEKLRQLKFQLGTFKSWYILSANAKSDVSSNLQGYSTQPSSPVPVQYQVG